VLRNSWKTRGISIIIKVVQEPAWKIPGKFSPLRPLVEFRRCTCWIEKRTKLSKVITKDFKHLNQI